MSDSAETSPNVLQRFWNVRRNARTREGQLPSSFYKENQGGPVIASMQICTQENERSATWTITLMVRLDYRTQSWQYVKLQIWNLKLKLFTKYPWLKPYVISTLIPHDTECVAYYFLLTPSLGRFSPFFFAKLLQISPRIFFLQNFCRYHGRILCNTVFIYFVYEYIN